MLIRSTKQISASTVSSAGSLVVLVAEDDSHVSRFLCQALRRAGFQVDESATGREALGRLEDRYYDLLVVDLSLPDRDGLEIVQIARSDYPEMKTLAISGFMLDEIRPIALRLGADAVLLKPFRTDRLLQAVTALVK